MMEGCAPIDKGKVTQTSMELLDFINEHHGEDAETLNVIAIAVVQAGSEKYIDFVLSEDTTVPQKEPGMCRLSPALQ